jgi:hypothetical protein
MAIRRCDRFRFDYFLRSCTADNLGKRCEQLMRAAESELEKGFHPLHLPPLIALSCSLSMWLSCFRGARLT